MKRLDLTEAERKARHAEQQRRYRMLHPEKAAASVKKYRAHHTDKVKAIAKKYRTANREKIRRRRREWSEANPTQAAKCRRRHYARYYERCIVRMRAEGADVPSPAMLSRDEQRKLVERIASRNRYAQGMLDPEYRAKRAIWEAAAVARKRERLAADPEAAERERKRVRESRRGRDRARYLRLRATPEGREELRAKSRCQKELARLRDPEGFQVKAREKARKRTAGLKVRVELSQEAKLRALRKLIPGYLLPDDRDDVLSDLTLAMLEGQCTPDKMRETIKKAASRYSAAQWKELSLDAPVPGLEGVTFLDLLSTQQA